MASSWPSDSWMKECAEATQLADAISALVVDQFCAFKSDPERSRAVAMVRQRFTMLATKLDRLESLLRNPPVNVNLSDKEMGRREDLLLQIRTRTKEMANNFRIQLSKRADLRAQEEKSPASLQQSSNVPNGVEKTQNTQEHAPLDHHEDPAQPVLAAVCTANVTVLTPDEEMNLQEPLVDSTEPSDSTFVQVTRIFSYLGKRAQEECSPLYICLVMIIFVVFIILLLSLLKLA